MSFRLKLTAYGNRVIAPGISRTVAPAKHREIHRRLLHLLDCS